MSACENDGDLHSADEFEFTRRVGGGLGTMNEGVIRSARALHEKFTNQIQQYGEESVKELMPLVVEVLETLNSTLEDNQDLEKQYETEKENRRKADKAFLELEDKLTSENMDARDEINQLNTKTRQLQSQLKHYKDRAERTEQRYDQLQTDHAELQEKHRKVQF
jgi:mitogen-activated protein kinase 8 interacting protein 3